jgi:spore coat protein A, manganese oxidase
VTDSPIFASEHSEIQTHPPSRVPKSGSETHDGITRRDVLKTGVFAAAAVALPVQRVVSARSTFTGRIAESKLPAPFTLPFTRPPVATPIAQGDTDYYHVDMLPVSLDILPGYKTPMFVYQTGGAPPSFPGSSIVVAQGRKVRMRHCNELPPRHPTLGYEPWTSVHLHGSASLPQYDGYASDITRPQQYKDYFYPNHQPARSLWYHDHGLHHTAENVYHGLAANYIINDPHEQSLPIPHGEFDVPMMISDAMFKSNGELLLSLDDESGVWGDVILVNGTPWPIMKVKARKYRFRFLNCSASRSYNFSLDDPTAKMWMIGTDGGLAPVAQQLTNWRHGAAERYEIVIDFTNCRGKKITMKNASPKNNRNFTNTNKVMMFDVEPDVWVPPTNAVDDNSNFVLAGEPIANNNSVMDLQVSQAAAVRQIGLVRSNSKWTINGNTWDKVVQSGYTHVEAKPVRGSVEIWEITNSSGGWFHPTHIHLIDFKILDRNGRPPQPWEKGPKDVVYVGENEKVRVIARFEGLGKYMIHCHNLIHEDHDMMSQFEVIDPNGEVGPDPVNAAPCKNLPETD